jgi:hypothetical protein
MVIALRPDEPRPLSYAISSICPVGADGGQADDFRLLNESLKNTQIVPFDELASRLAPLFEEPNPARKLLPARRSQRAVAGFVDHYNHRRYHESLDNLTPADVYFGRGQRIIEMRKEIKRRTIDQRRRQHFKAVA